MNPKQIHYEKSAHTIIENLKKRQIEGYYCATKEDAVTLAAAFISENDTVSFGGSMTLAECGMTDHIRSRSDITLLDRATASSPAESQEIAKKALTCDTYFMSTNAITLDGQLVNTDGFGNRIAALIFGPKQVIVMAGMNKVCPTLEAAKNRVSNMAAPPNCIRLNRNTPCATDGKCHDCQSPDCICAQTVITRRSLTPGRIKVILIGEELGY